ncbi:MAG: hypothetical protein IKF39_01415 [Oscillospiraceae bacterium]|nr:hypothetical protein [Oscillospiraceae bacterium]
MVSFLIGLVGAVIALVGWFGAHSLLLLAIGTLLYIIETVMESKKLNQGALALDIIVAIIGCIVGLFIKTPWYVSGMLAINIYSAVISLLGVPSMLALARKRK